MLNESIQAQLQLPFVEKRIAELANGSREEYDVVGPVEVKFKNRSTSCRALVLPGDSEPLLGSIPLEDMLACRVPRYLYQFLHVDVLRLKGIQAGAY